MNYAIKQAGKNACTATALAIALKELKVEAFDLPYGDYTNNYKVPFNSKELFQNLDNPYFEQEKHLIKKHIKRSGIPEYELSDYTDIFILQSICGGKALGSGGHDPSNTKSDYEYGDNPPMSYPSGIAEALRHSQIGLDVYSYGCIMPNIIEKLYPNERKTLQSEYKINVKQSRPPVLKSNQRMICCVLAINKGNTFQTLQNTISHLWNCNWRNGGKTLATLLPELHSVLYRHDRTYMDPGIGKNYPNWKSMTGCCGMGYLDLGIYIVITKPHLKLK
ncbi:MAG: hypothetical protein GY750_09730 [Lentisphaerae bacterium]|nr:hypothetical protein [Lentisphaerota bacterium]MCP4101690.1 hypothetical protein [Lentisphaerota bacterium]